MHLERPGDQADNVSYLQFELGGILLDFSAHMLTFVRWVV